jgi:hypothetical protein
MSSEKILNKMYIFSLHGAVVLVSLRHWHLGKDKKFEEVAMRIAGIFAFWDSRQCSQLKLCIVSVCLEKGGQHDKRWG